VNDRHLDHVGFEPRDGAREKKTVEEKTVSIAFTEAERCLLLSALARFEDCQVQWSKLAKAKGGLKEARARMETGKRILALSQRIEEAGER
jgi:hypothetical protein